MLVWLTNMLSRMHLQRYNTWTPHKFGYVTILQRHGKQVGEQVREFSNFYDDMDSSPSGHQGFEDVLTNKLATTDDMEMVPNTKIASMFGLVN